ncbi:MAG: class I SAM-dependent methyltransferase [Bacteroidetes bacterium]|nr:class I SAM-dependent methyltransferase [Bacteroidota bacterium]
MSSERQLLNHNDPWWGEHVHRYHEVLPYIQGEDKILDLACGTGFGSDILARHTTGMVTGGDIDAEAIKECSINWQRSNLEFRVLDGTKLDFPDAYFDKIVSFETIEHTTQYREMLHEFYRVLKPGGIAFISTPNFPINSPSGKVTNPYHTQEFVYEELEGILKEVFPSVETRGQKYSRYDHGQTPAIGKLVEWLFNIIGIRKLPYPVKNAVSQFFIHKPFYPTDKDFDMVKEKAAILKCKTFFCICRK